LSLAIGIKAAMKAVKGETRSVPRYVTLRAGKIFVASGPNFTSPGSVTSAAGIESAGTRSAQDELIAEIAIKGCTVKNMTIERDWKFVVTQPDGTQHVFKPA
jgi:hypothetical protein